MKVLYHKTYEKAVLNLKPAQLKRLRRALRLFELSPHHPDLYNYALGGQWSGHRSISFGGDWRAIYVPKDRNAALFVAVGTHSQLYK
jgi:addiction module RelE/StbE family toxin